MRTCLVVLFGSVVLAAVGCGSDPEGPFIAVELVEPPFGSQLGGQKVIVQGEGFINGAAPPNHVLFGEVLAETVTVLSDTELEVLTPGALAEGSVDVTVFNTNGFTVLTDAFSYHPFPVVTSVSPAQGNRAGGETVTITGTGFEANDAGGQVVLFGGTEAQVVSVNGDTSIEVLTPPGTLFKKEDVSVNNANGAGELPEGFQFVANGLIAATGGGGNCGFNNSELLFIDLDNGEILKLANSGGSPVTGLAALDDGRLIAMGGGLCCGDRPVFEIDVTTGERRDIGVTRRSSDLSTDGTTVFSMDRTAGATFGTINTETGEFTSIGGTNFNRGGLAVADDGTHFFANGNNLRTVDPTDGSVSDPPVVMTTGGSSAMTFHRGSLYVVRNQSLCFGGGGDISLFEVDPATGASTVAASFAARVDAIESADNLIGN